MRGAVCGAPLDHKGSSLDLTFAPSSGCFKLRQELRVDFASDESSLADAHWTRSSADAPKGDNTDATRGPAALGEVCSPHVTSPDA